MATGIAGTRWTSDGGRIGFVPALLTTIVVVLLGGLGVACGAPDERVPAADSTMVDVLLELHLAVARAEVTHEVPANIRDSILTAYNIDSTTYARAVSYYAENPDEYAEIYSRVLDRLNSERIPLGRPDDNEAAPPPPTRFPQ